MKTKTIFITSDGKEFQDKEKAEAHEKMITENEDLKKEVMELLSKICIHLKNFNPASSISPNNEYILSVKQIVDNLVTGDVVSANEYVNSYYNSSSDC